jgi:hypothetical protein
MKLLTHGGKQHHHNYMNVVQGIKGVCVQIHIGVWNYNKLNEYVDGDDDDDS